MANERGDVWEEILGIVGLGGRDLFFVASRIVGTAGSVDALFEATRAVLWERDGEEDEGTPCPLLWCLLAWLSGLAYSLCEYWWGTR